MTEHFIDGNTVRKIQTELFENDVDFAKFQERMSERKNPDNDSVSKVTNLNNYRKKKEKSRIITPDEPRIVRGYNEGTGEMEKFPFVSFSGIKENGLTAAKEYVMYNIFNGLYGALGIKEKADDSFLGGLIDTLFSANMLRYKAGYTNRVPKMFPLPYVWKRFAESPSDIDKVYTAKMAGYQFPVYLMDDKGKIPEPSDELLKENIDKTAETGATPYNERDIAVKHYKDFSTLAAKKYTRGDFERLEDPDTFKKWFVRDDTWLIQQKGELIGTKTITTDKGVPVEINIYKKPGKFETWKYWFVGDIIYDFVDAPLDRSIQPLIETYVPDKVQEFLRKEYTAISALRRKFINGGRTPLLYDVSDLSKSEAQTVGNALKAYR